MQLCGQGIIELVGWVYVYWECVRRLVKVHRMTWSNILASWWCILQVLLHYWELFSCIYTIGNWRVGFWKCVDSEWLMAHIERMRIWDVSKFCSRYGMCYCNFYVAWLQKILKLRLTSWCNAHFLFSYYGRWNDIAWHYVAYMFRMVQVSGMSNHKRTSKLVFHTYLYKNILQW